MTTRAWKLTAGSLALTAVLAGALPVQAQAPIKIGTSLSLTGTYAKPGTLDSDKVRDELLKLKIRTAFADYAVDQDGFQIAYKMVMLQWQDGKRMIVWPEELANAKPRYPTPPWSQR